MTRPFESTADPNETDEAREMRLRDESADAFGAGRFDESFNRMQQAGLDQAIRWFREEGVVFTKQHPTVTPLELIVGLASASHAELTERGEAASHKLSVAAGFLWALADLRLAIEGKHDGTRESAGSKAAEITMKSVVLGEMMGLANAVHLGWLDKMTDYEMDRERRRLGAMKSNAAKATAKQSALNEAVRIAAKNATLSNEALAIKLNESVAPNTTVKTLTLWVREWRRRGFLTAQTPT
jgi:hypothetical protein